jgi:hypothetical protein
MRNPRSTFEQHPMLIWRFYAVGRRVTSASLVVTLIASILWAGLPSTACVCVDGTIKLFCSGNCGKSECCCCGTHECSSACCALLAGSCGISDEHSSLDESKGALKRCKCHKLDKVELVLVSPVSERDDNNTQLDYSPIFNGNALPLVNPHCGVFTADRTNARRPQIDVVILFRHLVI